MLRIYLRTNSVTMPGKFSSLNLVICTGHPDLAERGGTPITLAVGQLVAPDSFQLKAIYSIVSANDKG